MLTLHAPPFKIPMCRIEKQLPSVGLICEEKVSSYGFLSSTLPATHRVVVPDGFPGSTDAHLLNDCHAPLPVDGHNLGIATKDDLRIVEENAWNLLRLKRQGKESFFPLNGDSDVPKASEKSQ